MEAQERLTVNIEDEMKRSYLDYAMSVIIGRALPDVRDGFKPVHRRVLWAMHELGNTYNKPYKKSARVVGDAIGKFHPHGEAAVYDTIVRLAQDFSMRYPLIDGQGNFGSVDGDEPAAMRYCVTGDTLVVTDKGLLPIAHISSGAEDIQIRILSHGGVVNTASKWFDSGEHPTYRVRTRHGYEIVGTSNHPLLVFRADEQGRPTFAWKTIEQLQRGDTLVIDRGEQLWPSEPVELRPYYQAGKDACAPKRNELPQFLNEDLAFVLGALTAEGTVQEHRIEFTNTLGDFANEFMDAWKRAFPTCRLHTQLRSPVSYGKRPFWQMLIVSAEVVALLHNLGLQGKSEARLVPEAILRSPQEVVAAFLRGLFEGDAVVERSGRSVLRITLCSISEQMLKQVQTLLLRFGIVSARYSDAKHSRQMHRLCIVGNENLRRFAVRIGFFSKAKRQALAKVLAAHSGRALSRNDYIPLLAAYVRRQAVQQSQWRRWLVKHNFDRPARLAAVLPRLALALSAPDFQMVEFLSRTNYLYDPIVAIEEAGNQTVYSLRVDSNCHSFVANGFVNHNTEVRLARIGDEILSDIEKETVDFQPNYDESLQEPKVLPTRIPNLLVNGASGIAVGMATNIPPHNLGEIIDATIHLIQKPNATVKELMKYVPGPDFPTGAFIYGRAGIKQAYETGRGMILMRARAAIDRVGRGSAERDAIVVTEIPYQVNKAKLIERIAELVTEKKLEGVADLRDESDREGMRIVIELKKEAVAQVILNKLYKLTPMQSSFGVINLAIVNGQPKVLNLVEMLQHFIDFRKEVVRRRTAYELKKAEARAHVLEGLKKALNHLDEVIKLIRGSKATEDARDALMQRFKFTEAQVQAILEMQLRRLSSLERKKIDDEYMELIKRIAELQEILASESVLKGVIVEELKAIKRDFADERRTQIVDEEAEFTLEDLIADEDVVITVTHSGYIKRTPLNVYRSQRRGGTGRRGAATRAEDVVTHIFVASTHSYLLIFTHNGQVYRIKVHEIPDASAAGRGKSIANLVNLPSSERVAGILTVRDFEPGKYAVMVTRKGVIKKTEITDYSNIRVNGIIAMAVDEGDELIAVELTDGKKKIFLATHDGMAICFDENDVRDMGRQARGVRGIDLREGDYVVSVSAVTGKEQMLSISEYGYGKRTPVDEYRFQSRGGIGVINMKTTERNGKVVAVIPVTDEDQVMIITRRGKVIRIEASNIRETGRGTQGVKLIEADSSDPVASATLIERQSESLAEAVSEDNRQ